jgi:mRNA interferase MazF
MITYNACEIVLLVFPYASTELIKKRPALILLDTEDEDIIVARVTSQSAKSDFDVVIEDWQKAGLLVPSIVRVNKIATLEKNLVERKLGILSAEDWLNVCNKIKQLWSF